MGGVTGQWKRTELVRVFPVGEKGGGLSRGRKLGKVGHLRSTVVYLTSERRGFFFLGLLKGKNISKILKKGRILGA